MISIRMFDADIGDKVGPTHGLVGSTQEDHGVIPWIHQREEFTCCLSPFISGLNVLFDSLCIIKRLGRRIIIIIIFGQS